ncbi:hypothetical protein B0H14DRAFT_3526938 [Mycena olivaceomarginata]|nr:hypothetical protein B0H14DRAFT_3526938 [Mycena olivaceomarginata]
MSSNLCAGCHKTFAGPGGLPQHYRRQSTARLIRCVRGALDFLYHSQYPIHSTETVDALTADLRSFHDNKSIFIDLGIRDNFKIPKLHNISHYPLHVQLFGTFDNYNTEHTERIHIYFTKDAYRATNRKDEAEYFRDGFARFVVGFQNPDFSKRQVEAAAADYFLPFQSVFVYHKIKFWNEDPLGRENAGDALDVVHVKPGYTNKHGRRIGG